MKKINEDVKKAADLISNFNEAVKDDSELNDFKDVIEKALQDEYGEDYLVKEFTMDVKFVNKSSNKNPVYTKEGDSGFDIRANEDVILKSKEYKVIPTGLYFDLPVDHELQVRPRSGLAAKYGITVLNTPGTVDNNYKGEIKVILINHGNEDFKIVRGDRIAQGVISYVKSKSVINLTEINEDEYQTNSNRGDKGFGSSGIS